MRTYLSLERRSYVLGLPLSETALLICLFLICVIGGSLAGIVLRVSWIYYACVFASIAALYLILRRAARQQRPQFLLSYISYTFYQPNVIYNTP